MKKQGLNIDTVVLLFPWVNGIDLLGWVRRKNGCYIKHTTTAYYMLNPQKHYLTMMFSGQGIQNGGDNHLPYSYLKTNEMFEKLQKDLLSATKNKRLIVKNAIITRIDINADYILNNEAESNELLSFFNMVKAPARMKKEKYKTGVVFSYKSHNGLSLKVYQKNKDIFLDEKIKAKMPPTVRIEFQLRKHKKITDIISDYCIFEVCGNPIIALDAWNFACDKFKLMGHIFDDKNFYKIAKTILNYKPKKWNRIKKLIIKQANDEQAMSNYEKTEYNKVANELYDCGVCPWSTLLCPDFSFYVSADFFDEVMISIFGTKKALDSTITDVEYGDFLIHRLCLLFEGIDSS